MPQDKSNKTITKQKFKTINYLKIYNPFTGKKSPSKCNQKWSQEMLLKGRGLLDQPRWILKPGVKRVLD